MKKKKKLILQSIKTKYSILFTLLFVIGIAVSNNIVFNNVFTYVE